MGFSSAPMVCPVVLGSLTTFDQLSRSVALRPASGHAFPSLTTPFCDYQDGSHIANEYADLYIFRNNLCTRFRPKQIARNRRAASLRRPIGASAQKTTRKMAPQFIKQLAWPPDLYVGVQCASEDWFIFTRLCN